MQKGQSGMNAAILIAVLAALIVVYIIFLPSDERLDIVGENASDGFSGHYKNEILLEEEQIIMEVVNDREIEHDLPSVNLFTSTESNIIRNENSIYVKNGLFDKMDKEFDFVVDDPDNTKNMLISFFAKKNKGRLIITLNDRVVYNREITKVNVDPIRISKDYLSKTNNVKVEVSGVGAAFWSTNEFLLENFQITADVTDLSTRESEVRFVVPASEANNIDSAEIQFVPECEPTEAGVLDILINNHAIYSSVPDCGIARPLEFAPANIVSGENKLKFRTTRGRYLVDQIKITTELIDQPSFVYYFDVTGDELHNIEDGDKKVNLTMFFVDDREDKEAEIFVNNRRTYMTRHDDFEWSREISNYIEEGSNSLKIIPEEKLEIRTMQITLEDK